MNISLLYQLFSSSPNVVTDSRKVVPNSIYFALKGANFNGNDFAQKALVSGASYAIVDEEIALDDPKIIKVDSVLKVLQNLANFHRKQFNIPVIGITGTNGKTTTKELLNAILSQKFNVLATEGNFNNHIGVPLTLLKIRNKHDIAIVEMGANHPGEIAELCKISEPNFGLVTNVGMAHLEGFDSFENIVSTKSDLYRFVESARGTNFILKENVEILNLLNEYKFIEYSCSDSTVENFGEAILKETFVDFSIKKLNSTDLTMSPIHTKMAGLYNQTNIMAAITIGNYFGLSLEEIKSGLESYSPNNNRSQIKNTERNQLLLDAYNANPTSVSIALENIFQIKADKKLIILGDMLELGDYSELKHQEIVDALMVDQSTKVILVGPCFYKTRNANHANLNKYQSLSDLINSAVLNQVKDALILLKGSRGMGLEKLVEYL